ICIHYLFSNRPDWSDRAAVGKTVVSSSLIDRVAAKLRRRLYEVPVGFKMFVDGLLSGDLGFAGEESAGSAFLRRNRAVCTTDEAGMRRPLVAAETTRRTGRDPGEWCAALTSELGRPAYERIDAPATFEEKAALAGLSSDDVHVDRLAGEPIRQVLTAAPGNG